MVPAPSARILIVEDENIVALDIESALREFRYEVLPVASSGEDALRLARELRPDLALMDIRLRGEMDGVEAARLLHAELDIPVIFLTAHTDEGTLQRAKLTEAFGYIVKPFEKQELRTAVDLAIHKHRMDRRIRESLERRADQASSELSRESAAREQAQEQLAESEERFRRIADSANDGILVADERDAIVYANPAALRMLGYAEDEPLAGRPMRTLIPDRHGEALARIRTGGCAPEDRTVELSARRKDGSEIPLEVSLACWTAGGRRYYAGIFRDITRRELLEDGLKFQANILSQVEAVLATDDGGRIVYANAGAEALYGRPAAEFIGLDIPRAVGARPEDADYDAVRRALAEKGAWQGKALHRRADGSPLYVDASVRLLRNEAGATVGHLAVIREQTERRRLENAFIHSERLASLGQLAAGLAHQLKTPLTVIVGYADVLARRFAGDPETAKPFDAIRSQALRCAGLITELLDFSRRKDPEEREPVDVNRAAESALSLVETAARERAVRVQRELSPGAPTVLGLQNLLEQVLVNLASNALDAMPKGGTLRVETKGFGKDGREAAQIRVADTGTGMPPEVRERIFEPFFTTKRGRNGTGLGLWVAHTIVANMDGSIQCLSEPGKGSEFVITLPALSEAAPAGAAAWTPHAAGSL
jgi:two-component system, cell cycle sensor histidine kinase and response regulator CckA